MKSGQSGTLWIIFEAAASTVFPILMLILSIPAYGLAMIVNLLSLPRVGDEPIFQRFEFAILYINNFFTIILYWLSLLQYNKARLFAH